MKILFITEKFPYPLDSGGRIRTYHILKGLSQEHELTLITTLERESQRRDLPELENLCRQVLAIAAPQETRLQLVQKLVANLFSQIPIVVERHYLPAVANAVRQALSTARPAFDVVHFDHLDASMYMSCLAGQVRTVLDEHNIVTNQIRTSARVEPNRLKRVYMRMQAQKTQQYEARVCARMTRCLVCSDTDQASLRQMSPEARSVTIPNGVAVEYFQDTSWKKAFDLTIPSVPHTLIFVGTLDYGPGATAVRYFCDDIFPRIQQDVADARFLAVGQNPPHYLHALAARDSRIVVTGRVDDIRPYVAQSRVFVVPLKSGSGTRLKILDAMAMGIPVVSTSIGAEGLDVVSGQHLLLADTPEAFSAAVVQLLRDDDMMQRLRANALRFVQERYDWPVIWKRLLAAYRELQSV